MAMLEICCPHCDNTVTMEVHILTKERSKGPTPHDPGRRVDNFIIKQIEKEGLSLAQVGELLTEKGIQTPRGGKWYPASVRRVYNQAMARREVRNNGSA